MARVKAKQPSNYGTRFKDISGQIANLPVFRENPQDPAGIAVSKGIIGYGAMGGGLGGPIGAVIGGAYGLVSSIFGISARNKAERRAEQERRRQYMERKRQQEETFVERRKDQLSGLERGLRRQVVEQTRYLHEGLSEQISKIQSPQRALTFQQTGRIEQMQSATQDKLISSEAGRIAFKTQEAIRLRGLVMGDIDNWQERIEDEGYEVAKDDKGQEIYKIKEGLKRIDYAT